MPKLDGYAATQQIRAAEEGGKRVPIIMLTAEADVGERVKGLRAGADDDIVKPFHPLELMARIKALLARGGTLTPAAAGTDSPTLGRLAVFYGAKGGVGTTTIAINTAIAMTARDAAAHRTGRRQPAVRRPARLPGPRPGYRLDRERGQRAGPGRRPAAQADRPAPDRHRPAARAALAGGGRHRHGAPADRSDHAQQPAGPVAAACTTTPSSTW